MKISRLVFIFLVFVITTSCENEEIIYIEDEEPLTSTPVFSQLPKPYHSQDGLSRGVAISSYTGENNLGEKDYWALAECDCYYSHKSSKLKYMATQKGLLPEVMTSPVRAEILENNLLKVANSLLGNLGQALANEFVSDETVNEAIHEGISEGMVNTVPGGSYISKERLRLDSFGPWYNERLQTKEFTVSEQSSKWLTIMSMEELFKGKNSKLDRDHGLQVFHIIKSLVELQYAFGIDGYHGTGLTLNPNYQFGIMPFDPRTNNGAARTLSGKYTVSFKDNENLLKLAINPSETWHHSGSEITLEEQTKLWMTMAYMFKTLRPNNREHISKMFETQGGLLPNDAHLIALTVLPSLSDILSEKLIDQDNRLVRASVDKYGNEEGLADPVALARMMNSIQLWANELGDLSDVDVDGDLLAQLSEAVPSFKDAVRLSVQHMINRYLEVTESGEVSILKAVDYDLSKAGEVVESLIKVNYRLIESDLLKELTFEVARSYVYYVVSVMNEHSSEVKFSDVVWLYRVLDQLSRYDSNSLGMPWIDEVKLILSAYIAR